MCGFEGEFTNSWGGYYDRADDMWKADWKKRSRTIKGSTIILFKCRKITKRKKKRKSRKRDTERETIEFYPSVIDWIRKNCSFMPKVGQAVKRAEKES